MKAYQEVDGKMPSKDALRDGATEVLVDAVPDGHELCDAILEAAPQVRHHATLPRRQRQPLNNLAAPLSKYLSSFVLIISLLDLSHFPCSSKQVARHA